MKKVRIGIIGTGMAFERLHYPAYEQLQDRFEIAAVCDVDREKAKRWQQRLGLREEDVYDDFRKMITREDIDAFDIMVPIELNFGTMEAVAKAGKPILCEKPVAATKEEARAARDLPKRFNVPIVIAENYRYNDENNIIRDLVGRKDRHRVLLHPKPGHRRAPGHAEGQVSSQRVAAPSQFPAASSTTRRCTTSQRCNTSSAVQKSMPWRGPRCRVRPVRGRAGQPPSQTI